MIRVHMEGLDALQQLMRSSPRITQRHMERAVDKAVEHLRNEVVKRTPSDRSRLRQSIGAEVSTQGASVVGVVGSSLSLSKTAKGYLEPVETGSRPHWPPRGALQPWARRHGFPAGSSGDYLVRRSIAMHGTKGAHMFEKGYDAGRRKVQRYFEKALEGIARDLAKG